MARKPPRAVRPPHRTSPMKQFTILALGSLLSIACRSTHEPTPAQSDVHPSGEVSVETIAPEGSMEAVVDRGDAPTVEALQAQADAEYARLVEDLSGQPVNTLEAAQAEGQAALSEADEASAQITRDAAEALDALQAEQPQEDMEIEEAPLLRAGPEAAEWGQEALAEEKASVQQAAAELEQPAQTATEEAQATMEEFSKASTGKTQEAAAPPLVATTTPALDPASVEARMQAIATPGDEHRWLDPLQGRWKAEVQYWMLPDTDPVTSTGVMTNAWALEGRFLQLDYVGSVMGQPFQGFGHIGYDKVREQYVGYWVDSMGTQMMNVSTGILSRDQKSLTLRRQAIEPMTGKQREVKEVLTLVGPNEHHWEMWGYAPDGSYFQMVNIVYRRVQ